MMTHRLQASSLIHPLTFTQEGLSPHGFRWIFQRRQTSVGPFSRRMAILSGKTMRSFKAALGLRRKTIHLQATYWDAVYSGRVVWATLMHFLPVPTASRVKSR